MYVASVALGAPKQYRSASPDPSYALLPRTLQLRRYLCTKGPSSVIPFLRVVANVLTELENGTISETDAQSKCMAIVNKFLRHADKQATLSSMDHLLDAVDPLNKHASNIHEPIPASSVMELNELRDSMLSAYASENESSARSQSAPRNSVHESRSFCKCY